MAKHMDPLLFTIAQSCRIASIGRTKLYELIANGEIPVRKVGSKSLIAGDDLKRWANQLPIAETKSAARGRSELSAA
jgi:excisionase family DNA binding protein